MEFKKKDHWKRAAGALLICALLFGQFAGCSGGQPAKSTGMVSDKMNTIYKILKQDWYYRHETEDLDSRLTEQAIAGMTTLDEDLHTNYFSLEQAEDFSSRLSGSSKGIGLGYFNNSAGQMQVSKVYVNSPAEQAGVQMGDIILSISGESMSNLSNDERTAKVADLVGNAEGPVSLEILRDGQTLSLEATPDVFDSTVVSYMKDGTGVIELSSFSEYSGDDFVQAAARLKDQGAKKLVIDLRDNSGGYLSAAVRIASALLPEGAHIMKEETRPETEFLSEQSKWISVDPEVTKTPFEKIAILQNGNTASAAEVLIGALKDNLGSDVVTTYGTTTYGKGTEQTQVPFKDGTSFKYTFAKWYTPNNVSIDKVGFAPDVELESQWDQVSAAGFVNLDQDVIEPDTVAFDAAPVQLYLQYLGYPVTRTDQYFAPESSQALFQFQQDTGLEPTGRIDQATLETLFNRVTMRHNEEKFEKDEVLNAALQDLQNA